VYLPDLKSKISKKICGFFLRIKVEVSIVWNNMNDCIDDLTQQRQKAGIDGEKSAPGLQYSIDLAQSVPRSEEMVKNPRQGDGIK
jgi:hypothetical protein